MGGIQDTEMEKCQSIEEIIELIKKRKQTFETEKENIEIHFKEKTNNPTENVEVRGDKNVLKEIKETSENIIELYDKCIDSLTKYKDKISIEKTVKFMKKICNFANEREVANMNTEAIEFEFYCEECSRESN
jgi:hypothetical protein